MKIEFGINPNCSESTVRFKTNELTKEQEEILFKALSAYVEKYNYETNIARDKFFGIQCITVDGDAPYNDGETIKGIIEKFTFKNKIQTDWSER